MTTVSYLQLPNKINSDFDQPVITFGPQDKQQTKIHIVISKDEQPTKLNLAEIAGKSGIEMSVMLLKISRMLAKYNYYLSF